VPTAHLILALTLGIAGTRAQSAAPDLSTTRGDVSPAAASASLDSGRLDVAEGDAPQVDRPGASATATEPAVAGDERPAGAAPAPEPSTLLLVGSGLVAFAWMARRSRREVQAPAIAADGGAKPDPAPEPKKLAPSARGLVKQPRALSDAS